MKRNLFLLFVLVTSLASAQFTLETQDGDPIVEGQTVAYGTLDEATASLHFWVFNESTTDEIYMKVELVSATNYDETDMQVCFGLCYDPVLLNFPYPPGNDVVIIQPGEHQTSSGDKFWNYNDGGGSIIDYNFRFFQVDENGVETGDELNFTYRYDPNLGVNDNNIVNAQIASTMVKDLLVVDANEATKLQIFDIQGRAVLTQELSAGINNINVANLPSQLYLVQMSNDRGAKQTTKIVKR